MSEVMEITGAKSGAHGVVALPGTSVPATAPEAGGKSGAERYGKLLEYFESKGLLEKRRHPVVPVPSAGQVQVLLDSGEDGWARLLEVMRRRKEGIDRERTDPYRFGYVPQVWKDARYVLRGPTSVGATAPEAGAAPSGAATAPHSTGGAGGGQAEACTTNGEKSGAHGVVALPALERSGGAGAEVVRALGEGYQGCTLLSLFGGNRQAKTGFAIWDGIELLASVEGSKVLFLHETLPRSIEVHQNPIFWRMPKEWREVRKVGRVTNMSWTEKNGFSNERFVTPIGSKAFFGAYMQDLKNYEGDEYDLIVADESLPLGWLKSLLMRLGTRAGKFVWPFTPVYGITPAVKEVVTGARTLLHKRAEFLSAERSVVPDCPPGRMPYVQRSAALWTEGMVMYFHYGSNPYGDQFGVVRRQLEGGDDTYKERRGYGWARNVVGNAFPMFSEAHLLEGE